MTKQNREMVGMEYDFQAKSRARTVENIFRPTPKINLSLCQSW